MSNITVISPKFSQADNLWNITKISQNGQSVGGQSEGYNCTLNFQLTLKAYLTFLGEFTIVENEISLKNR